MTYALLIYRSLPGSQPLSAEAEDEVLAGHRALQAEAASAGELHAVARLAPPDGARTVVGRRGAHEVTDGPYAETKEWLVGFYLIDCDDEEQAAARAAQISPDDHHVVEIRPVAWTWKP
jgi:hypothetical protein